MQYILNDADLDNTAPIIPIHIVYIGGVDALLDSFTQPQSTYAKARGFTGESGQIIELPAADGSINKILMGLGTPETDELGPLRTGALATHLPAGQYDIVDMPPEWSQSLAALGWGLGGYKFDRYLPDNSAPKPQLDIRTLADKIEVFETVRSINWGRDLINTPASDMGPEMVEQEARKLESNFGARFSVTKGPALKSEYPMIYAVGKAAEQGPRLIEIKWGNPGHPKLAIVGKGITFDTGGLNIKSASGARIMKKDMGGAAHAMALGRLIMATGVPVHLHILLAVAENSISSSAYRPGDILKSRSGKTVEIDNTDAEGRLVLGDALTKAVEDKPKLIIDFATLTGAARVALGPSLPPYFTNRMDLVDPVVENGALQFDPVWNMPLWQPYLRMLKSPIADLKNSGGSFAGCITAALFLQQFAGDGPWMHFDVYGWNPSSGPAHPAGGEIFAVRALHAWLKSGGIENVKA